MTRGSNSHPSSYGRMILRSLVDSSRPAEPAGQSVPTVEAAGFTPPTVASATHRLHPRQAAAGPLGKSPPRAAHMGQPERSVKPPRMPAAGRNSGEARHKR